MDRNQLTSKQRKQLRFAEGGILFVVILALTIFVGLKFAKPDRDEAAATIGRTDDTIPAAEVVTNAVPSSTTAGTSVDDNSGEGSDAGAAGAATVVTAGPAGDAVENAATPAAEPVTYTDAESAYLAGDYDEAVSRFEAYTAARPDNAWGYYMLGLSLWKSGDAASAEIALRSALELQPDHVKSRINLGRVLLDQQRADTARTLLEATVADAPENAAAWRVLARSLHTLGDSDAAIAAYREALRLDGEDAWSLNNLALIFIEQERFEPAVAAAAAAVQLRGDVACFHNNLGIALERTERPAAAAAAFESALQIDAAYENAAISLARLEALGVEADPASLDLAMLSSALEPLVLSSGATMTAAEPDASGESAAAADEAVGASAAEADAAGDELASLTGDEPASPPTETEGGHRR
jgi:Flp pilus assembly protein TadD